MKENELTYDPFMIVLCDDLVFVYKYHGDTYNNAYIVGRCVSQGSQYSYTPTLQKTQNDDNTPLTHSDDDDILNQTMYQTPINARRRIPIPRLQRNISVPVQQSYFDNDLESSQIQIEEQPDDIFSIKPNTIFAGSTPKQTPRNLSSMFYKVAEDENMEKLDTYTREKMDKMNNAETDDDNIDDDMDDGDDSIDEYIIKECVQMNQFESTFTSPYATCSRTSTIRALSQHDPNDI